MYDRIKEVKQLKKNKLRTFDGKFLIAMKTKEAKDQILSAYPKLFWLPWSERPNKGRKY